MTMRWGGFTRKTLAILLSLILLLVLGLGVAKVLVSTRWCGASWGRPFHLTQGNIAFPDAHGAYWVRFLSAPQTAKRLGFKIHGQFAHARYESFVAYAHSEQGTTVHALLDRDLAPDT